MARHYIAIATALLLGPAVAIAQQPSRTAPHDKSRSELTSALMMGSGLDRRVAVAGDNCRETMIAQREHYADPSDSAVVDHIVTLGTRLDFCQKRSIARGISQATFRMGLVAIEPVGEEGCKFSCKDGTACVTVTTQAVDQMRPSTTQEVIWTHTYSHAFMAPYCKRLMAAQSAPVQTAASDATRADMRAASQNRDQSDRKQTSQKRAATEQPKQPVR